MEQQITKFSRIICCGGDGVPLQVFSSLMRRTDNEMCIKIPVCMIPAGTIQSFYYSFYASSIFIK